jgi:CRISPR/Cas system CMR subunit Cmr4 (Cas7 group RAMP superfamily)
MSPHKLNLSFTFDLIAADFSADDGDENAVHVVHVVVPKVRVVHVEVVPRVRVDPVHEVEDDGGTLQEVEVPNLFHPESVHPWQI